MWLATEGTHGTEVACRGAQCKRPLSSRAATALRPIELDRQ